MTAIGFLAFDIGFARMALTSCEAVAGIASGRAANTRIQETRGAGDFGATTFLRLRTRGAGAGIVGTAFALALFPLANVRAALRGGLARYPHVETAEGVRLGRLVLPPFLVLVPFPGRRNFRMYSRDVPGKRAYYEAQEETPTWPGAAQYARDMIEVLRIHRMLISFPVTLSNRMS